MDLERKTNLAVSLVAVFAVTMIGYKIASAFVTAPGGFVATDGTATQIGNNVKMSVTTAAPIPRFPESYIDSNAVVLVGLT